MKQSGNGTYAHYVVKNEHVIMHYYDDIEFVYGEEIPQCRTVIDHRFDGLYSLQLKLDGRMSFGVDESAPVIYTGPLLFWHHPAHRYRYSVVGDSGWHHLWCSFRGERARRIIEQGFMTLSADHCMPVQEPDRFARVFMPLVMMVKARTQGSHAESTVLLERILNLASGEAAAKSQTGRNSQQRVREAETAMREQTSKSVDVRRLAKAAGMSDGHFRRVFRQQYGLSPHHHLLMLVMHRAADLLSNSALPVSSIAYILGYEDPAQFSKTFRGQLGLSPMRWRSTHGHRHEF